MNNEMAYIYTGEIMIDSSDIGNYTIDGLCTFYNYLEGIIAKKLGVDYETVELCKFSCDPEKDYIKANYKLHYTVATNLVRNAVYSALDNVTAVRVLEVNFRASGDRKFNIDIDTIARNSDSSVWEAQLIPSEVEAAANKVLPKDLIPVVKFNVSYPVITMANSVIG